MSPMSCRGVELGDEFAVRSTRGVEVLVAFVELQAQVDDLLFEVADFLVERVDIRWNAET